MHIYTYLGAQVDKNACKKVHTVACIYFKYVFSQMHVYIAEHSHRYPYMQLKCTQQVHAIYFQRIYIQEAGVCYTSLMQLWYSTT